MFFHRKTRTLIFTDLLFNIACHDSAYARFLLRLDGAFHGPAIPRSFRLLLRRRRAECVAFLHRLLSWDFDRAILAHGEIIHSGAKPAIERAWRFAQSADTIACTRKREIGAGYQPAQRRQNLVEAAVRQGSAI